MVLAKRIIPCLDIKEGRVVKGVNFVNIRDAGDPVELAQRYDEEGADELTFLDITASSEKRDILIDVVRRTAEVIFIPFTVGGGIRTTEDFRRILRAGADKCSINSGAVKNPDVINKAAKIFGAQCVVTAIDVKRRYVEKDNVKQSVNGPDLTDNNNHVVIQVDEDKYCWWEVVIHGGRTDTGMDAIKWGLEVENRGSGEILLTSMDTDGMRTGYDLELTKEFSERLNVPVIASGGAGNEQHILDVFSHGKADAALAASIFHDIGEDYHRSIEDVKDFLERNGITVRHV
ncbi:MAG: imidazole glycerol phosphate synthase subunit HisF [Candidatus Lokiarchaeota archaeon]|nr:imidazole glycerol phosphate synthase subunit HisF [Candidatus Lokiarchaeota archaeon]